MIEMTRNDELQGRNQMYLKPGSGTLDVSRIAAFSRLELIVLEG
jgi:hypothetical protein